MGNRHIPKLSWPCLMVALKLGVAAGAEPNANADASAWPTSERTAVDPNDYDGTMLLAKSAAVSGDLETARRLLMAALAVYPQDVELPLQLAWVLFRSGSFSQAEQFYRMTLTRTDGGGEAELGLAWSLQKQDDCQEAVSHFRAVLAKQRTSASAKEGLALCILQLSHPAVASPVQVAAPATISGAAEAAPLAKVWARPQLSQGLYVYRTNPLVNYVLTTTARLELLIQGHFYGAATYRYSRFVTLANTQASWNQHELYLDAGYTAPISGLSLHYALAADGSGYYGNSHHVGISARYSGAGDLLLDLAGSFYNDGAVLRGELAWRVPIYGGLSIRPGGALQWTAAESFRTLQLSANYDHRIFSLWLGGKYGDERRAAYLDLAFIYNTPARIPYGLWSGISFRPGARFSIQLNYGYDRLVRTDVTPNQDSTVHYLTLGLSKEL